MTSRSKHKVKIATNAYRLFSPSNYRELEAQKSRQRMKDLLMEWRREHYQKKEQ